MTASPKAYQRGAALPSSNPFQRLAELLADETPGLDPIIMTIGEPQHPIPDFTAEILAEKHGQLSPLSADRRFTGVS